MAAIPKYAQELIADGKVHTDQLMTIRGELNELWTSAERGKEDHAGLRGELAVLKQQLADQVKKSDEWDRRWWSIVTIFVGALLSLSAG